MPTLLITFLGVLIVSLLGVVTLVYMPSKAVGEYKMHKEVLSGYKRMESAAQHYFKQNRINDEALFPGANQNMWATLFPDYGYQPTPGKTGVAWRAQTALYLNNEPALALCANVKSGYQAALAKAAQKLSQGATTQGNSCASLDQNTSGHTLTYWMAYDHFIQNSHRFPVDNSKNKWRENKNWSPAITLKTGTLNSAKPGLFEFFVPYEWVDFFDINKPDTKNVRFSVSGNSLFTVSENNKITANLNSEGTYAFKLTAHYHGLRSSPVSVSLKVENDNQHSTTSNHKL